HGSIAVGGLETGQRHGGTGGTEHSLEEPSVHLAHEVPMLLEQIVEGALPERDLDGPGRAAPEPRVEPRLGQSLLERGEIGTAAPASPRLRRGPADQVLAPGSGLIPGSLPLATAPQEPGEDV